MQSAAEEEVKLPRSSFKIIRMIILGYLHQGGTAGKPATLQSVARATGLHHTMVSGNNAGLADLGIIEKVKGGPYALTKPGTEIARALEFEEPELVKRSLAPLLLSHEPISAAVSAIRIRGGMTEDGLANQLALGAGEPRTGPVLTGARAIIEMLLAAGILDQDGDRLTVAAQPPSGDIVEGPTTTDYSEPVRVEDGMEDRNTALRGSQQHVPSFVINITLSADDLADDEKAAKILLRLSELRGLIGNGNDR